MKNYIINGRVAREEIASDICDGVISREDIETLVKNPDIRAAFIGASYNKKKNKQEWDSNYLDVLPNVAVAEAFNEEFLYYLADVTEYVKANKSKKFLRSRIWFAVAIAAFVVIACIGIGAFFIIKSQN